MEVREGGAEGIDQKYNECKAVDEESTEKSNGSKSVKLTGVEKREKEVTEEGEEAQMIKIGNIQKWMKKAQEKI